MTSKPTMTRMSTMHEQEARQIADDIMTELIAMPETPAADKATRRSVRAFLDLLRAYREFSEELDQG